ncbi:MAG: hypothetical protein IJH75_01685 [Mogibacterium sp.]|nr:hypothetical protein [Mogibacterium sp.]
MADLRVTGMEGFEAWLNEVSDIPASVQTEILDSMAEVYAQAQRRTAQSMLQGPYNKGAVAQAVTRSKAVVGPNFAQEKITFEGHQHGTRIAEIAFINEYGKTNQPARPFIFTANEQVGDQATAAGAAIFYKFMEGK